MINGKGAFAIDGSGSGIVAIALIAIIVAIFFFLFLGNSSLSNSSSSSNAVKNSSVPYIELKYDEWIIDPLNVYIVVNENTQEQSKKYLDDTINAINKWSYLLKEYSGNYDSWNLKITTSIDKPSHYSHFEKDKSTRNIVIELVGELEGYECSSYFGYSDREFSDTSPDTLEISAKVFTSCPDDSNPYSKNNDLPHDLVYSTVSHEFGHILGLGHAHNIDGDLMCSIEEDEENGNSFESCYKDRSKKIEPSESDIKALLYKYKENGFKTPNRKLEVEGEGGVGGEEEKQDEYKFKIESS
jgi:predicted Zn-dependent protease